MKLRYLVILAISLSVLLACEQKQTDTTAKVKDKVDDALDRRPHEKARDAIEDITSAAKEASEEAQGKIKEITEEIKSQAKDAAK